MTTLAEHMIVAGVDNRPPMLEKLMYNSWKSHDCDLRATNIILQGLPPNIYALVNHNKHAKEIWDRVKLLMQGTELSYKEHECKLYNDFDKFASIKGLSVPSFLPRDDLITSLNKDISFLNTTIVSRFPSTNNQLITSFNPRNQANVQDGRVIVQQVQRRQGQGYVGNSSDSNDSSLGVNINGGKNPAGQARNAAFQTDDLDAFDSDCDEALGASAAFMAHLSSYESYDILEVPNSNYYQDNNVPNMCVPVESYFEQSTSLLDQDIEITSDSNIISYEQYLQETASASVQNNTSTNEQTAMIMSVFDAQSVQVAKCTADNLKPKDLDASLTVELESYKERVKQLEDR
ncbi:hypothetical protein Tco_1383953 [Tanacetum coccineum]